MNSVKKNKKIRKILKRNFFCITRKFFESVPTFWASNRIGLNLKRIQYYVTFQLFIHVHSTSKKGVEKYTTRKSFQNRIQFTLKKCLIFFLIPFKIQRT